MDIQRNFLWMSLIFIIFLMWQAWQEDYGQAVSPTIAKQASTSLDSGRLKSELPDIQSKDSSGVAIQSRREPLLQAKVQVKTDLYDLHIGLEGGDILKADLVQLKASNQANSKPYSLLNANAETFYVAQSGLISDRGPDFPNGTRLSFKANQFEYEMAPDQDVLEVPIEWHDGAGLKIKKLYRFQRGSYLVGVRYLIDNQSQSVWDGRFYGQLKQKEIKQSRGLGASGYSGSAFSSKEKAYEKVKFDNLRDAAVSQQSEGGWVALVRHYFLTAWIPPQMEQNHYYSKYLGNEMFRVGFVGEQIRVEPGQVVEVSGALFVGPKIQSQLKAAAENLQLNVDYGWLWFIAQPLFWLLKWFHQIVGNWGWAIILVTIVVKMTFFKLSATSYRSMANMRRIHPKLTSLKERYGDDRQKLSQEMMQLYKQEKINPLGGCLPILVQIPVFIALYWVLLESVELRHAPFIGWITDLSAKDPFYVLPVLMGVTMFVQQRLNPAPVDPIQAKVMKMFPFVFTIFFMFFPAGLVLYWFVSNLLSIAQQWLITRVIMKESPAIGGAK